MLASEGSAQQLFCTNCVVASLDTTTIPTNPANGYGAFQFLDYPPLAIIDNGVDPWLNLDITDLDGSSGIFGGVGVDFVAGVGVGTQPNTFATEFPLNFDPNLATWEVSVRIDPTNQASTLRTTMVDVDGPETLTGYTGGTFPPNGDEHFWDFDLTTVPADGNFHLLTLPVALPTGSQGAFGSGPGNLLVDPGLKQIQIQSPFGSVGDLHVDVQFARIVTTGDVTYAPEPSSCVIALIGAMLVGATRRT